MIPETGNEAVSRNSPGIVPDKPGRGPGFFGFRSGLGANVRPFVIDDGDIYLRPSFWDVPKNTAIDNLFSTPQKDEMTCRLLGMPGQDHALERRYFFSRFSWSGVDLLGCLKDLCQHLYLRAESQNLERVLDMFSARWLFCNPTSVLESKDTVHTLAYSLLMLNTDLHGSDLEESRKMTCGQFCDNTMSVLSQSSHIHSRTAVRSLLSRYYSEIESLPLPLLGEPTKNRRQSYVQRTATTVKERFKSNSSTQEAANLSDAHFEGSKSSPRLNTSRPVTKIGRLKVVSDASALQVKYDPTILYSASVTGDGCLNIFDPLKKQKSLNLPILPVFSNDDLSTKKVSVAGRKRLATVSLSQSLSTEDPDSPLRWSLETRGCTQFECSQEDRDAFVFACNYWAARMSKVPLREAITNTNYGWNGDDGAEVAEWLPPAPLTSSAILPIGQQVDSLKAFLVRLENSDIKQHKDLKRKIQNTYKMDSVPYKSAMDNWDKKLQYLEKLRTRFSCYLDTLSNM